MNACTFILHFTSERVCQIGMPCMHHLITTQGKWEKRNLREECQAGPSPGYSNRGVKNQKKGQKTETGPHFKNTVLNVCINQRAKREMGGHRFQMGGRAPLAPRWRRPWCQGVLKQDLVLDFISWKIGFHESCLYLMLAGCSQ